MERGNRNIKQYKLLQPSNQSILNRYRADYKIGIPMRTFPEVSALATALRTRTPQQRIGVVQFTSFIARWATQLPVTENNQSEPIPFSI
jgi:hypothetical protein